MEIIEYNGHVVTLDVADRGKGWTWTYQIGSGPVIASVGAPHLSATLARLEAVAVAEREIDCASAPPLLAPATGNSAVATAAERATFMAQRPYAGAP